MTVYRMSNCTALSESTLFDQLRNYLSPLLKASERWIEARNTMHRGSYFISLAFCAFESGLRGSASVMTGRCEVSR